jgi:hypothetical protein
MYVTAQSIQTGDNDAAFPPARLAYRFREHRPPIERVRPLAGFDFDGLPNDGVTLGFRKACDGPRCASSPSPLLPCRDVLTRQ